MRALLSVYDKTGIVELATGLHELGWDLVSSGGTATAIRDAGIPVADTAEVTGFPAILGHRVVTLHPKIHGGILADRSPEHLAEMEQYGIEAIDLVVGNLYPFGSDPSAFAHGGGTAEDVIDIGGPAMVRAAAKNHAHVGVVVDPADYPAILDELRAVADGTLSADTRRRLARTAFAHTAAYDAAVVAWFDEADDPILPPTLHVAATREDRTLRYGENPHQRAALYRTDGADPWWATATQHGGIALSYLNLYDADAAWLLAHDLGAGAPATGPPSPSSSTPTRAAPRWPTRWPRPTSGPSSATPARRSAASSPSTGWSTTPPWWRWSPPPRPTSSSPPATPPAWSRRSRPSARTPACSKRWRPTPATRHLRPISGGWLVQEPHRLVAQPADWQVVTERVPTDAELADAELAFRICAAVTSNSIVLAKDGVAWGIGAGQQNRVEAGQIAAEKAAGRAAGGACASDAFYPFPDGIEAAAAAGVAVIVQPGGSVKDADNIAKANELGVAMVFTGERQFKH